MADYPSTTRWLTPEERILAAKRLAHDGIGNTQGVEGEIKESKAFRMTVTDWRVWVLVLLYMLVTGSQTMQYFIPTLVKDFGWSDWSGQFTFAMFWVSANHDGRNVNGNFEQITRSHPTPLGSYARFRSRSFRISSRTSLSSSRCLPG